MAAQRRVASVGEPISPGIECVAFGTGKGIDAPAAIRTRVMANMDRVGVADAYGHSGFETLAKRITLGQLLVGRMAGNRRWRVLGHEPGRELERTQVEIRQLFGV